MMHLTLRESLLDHYSFDTNKVRTEKWPSNYGEIWTTHEKNLRTREWSIQERRQSDEQYFFETNSIADRRVKVIHFADDILGGDFSLFIPELNDGKESTTSFVIRYLIHFIVQFLNIFRRVLLIDDGFSEKDSQHPWSVLKKNSTHGTVRSDIADSWKTDLGLTRRDAHRVKWFIWKRISMDILVSLDISEMNLFMNAQLRDQWCRFWWSCSKINTLKFIIIVVHLIDFNYQQNQLSLIDSEQSDRGPVSEQ